MNGRKIKRVWKQESQGEKRIPKKRKLSIMSKVLIALVITKNE